MSTSNDLNDIMNWSSAEDVFNGSNVECSDSSKYDEENTKPNVAVLQT